MSTKQPRNIIIAGASGTIGTPILKSLLATGLHKVSVLTRIDSQTTFPATVTVHKGDYTDASFLATALAGKDVLITALHFSAYDAQIPLFRAAAQAGVPWVVPTEYGSDATAGLNEHIGLMAEKKQFRDLIEELGVSAWIGVVCNPWIDWVMNLGGFGLDLRGRSFSGFLDDGETKANFTTLRRVGESLAAVLSLPEEELQQYRNGWVYFSSVYVSQQELLAASVRATGTAESDWSVTKSGAWEKIQALKEAMAKGDRRATPQLLMTLVFTPGLGGDYNDKVVAYGKLGLESESLDDIMKSVVEKFGI